MRARRWFAGANAGHTKAMAFAEEEEKRADEETLPETSLHAYGQGREEDIEGDSEKLESGDPETSQRREISEGDDPGVDPPEKH